MAKVIKFGEDARKRYGFTAKGKVKRTAANSRHRLSTKTSRQKMSRRQSSYADKTCVGGIKKLLPYD